MISRSRLSSRHGVLIAVGSALAVALGCHGEIPTSDPRHAETGLIAGTSSVDVSTMYIAGGSFDGHTISAFEMDRTEVTVAAYRLCVQVGACAEPAAGPYTNYFKAGHEDHPVNKVSWYDARDYCAWRRARLATEWEWEWAARGREEGRSFAWGETSRPCRRPQFDDEGGCGREPTWPVGSKPAGASRDGIQDMAGNIWEWTDSWYDDDRDRRVLRGGGWDIVDADILRVDYRINHHPSFRFDNNGARCVVSASAR